MGEQLAAHVLRVWRQMRMMKIFAAVLSALALLTTSATPSDVTMSSEMIMRFVSVHGRLAWAGGYPNAGLEVWTGALQIASDVQPEFLRGGDVTPVPGPKLLARVAVSPSHSCRVYVGPDFTAVEDVWIPADHSALILRYTVHGVAPVQVIVRFRPSLNLMWPAAIGGQSVHWDAAQSGYVITEPTKQFAAVVIAPGATAHDDVLNDTRTASSDELAISLDPHSPRIIFAQGTGTPDSLSAPSSGATEERSSSSEWQEALNKHYDDILSSGLQIETPDPDVNRALAWAEIDLDQDWFCNEKLGCGYVAGYGPSRRARRPQYAWYFAGDGMIALEAALAAGDLERARDELRFIAKYQDPKTGMIWHELSQSSPYIDWLNKYPYMFVHAELSYPYISAVADYVRRSNDREFLSEIWPSTQRAFAYGRLLIAEDGLPRIPAEKEGSDEQNSLSEELALSANWIAACDDYGFLSELMGDVRSEEETTRLALEARAAFSRRYWSATDDFVISGYRRNGAPITEHGISGVHALRARLFTNDKRQDLLDKIASWRFQSDWGTRSVAVGEPGFNPTGYVQGSVSGLRTAEVAQAFWMEHRPDIGFEIWCGLIPWFSLDSLGHMHEVLRGDVYAPQSESVPEQTWSSAGFLSAAVHGLLGLEANATKGILALAPHLPPKWDRVTVRNVRMGTSNLTFTFQQSFDSLAVHVENTGNVLRLNYRPAIPLGSRNVTTTMNGRKLVPKIETHGEDQHADLQVEVPHGGSDISLHYDDGVQVIMPAVAPSVGESSSAMKLTSLAFEKGVLTLGVDVSATHRNALKLLTTRTLKSARNASFEKLANGSYELTIAAGSNSGDDGYHHEQIEVVFENGSEIE